jgi:hypothetical protein
MDNGKPVTKAELDSAVGSLKSELIEAMRSQKDELVEAMRSQKNDLVDLMRSQKDELVDSMRQIKTNLLTEFHRYAKGQSARVHNVEVSEYDMKVRLSTLEDRVLALETRLPPSAL